MAQIIIYIISLLVGSFDCAVLFPSNAPVLSAAIIESTEGYNFFLNVWGYALQFETNAKTNLRLEPKTFLLPGDHSMAHLIPQDGAHPLYIADDKHSKLRMEFILDHLVLKLVPSSHPDVASQEGMSTVTLSGKPVTIRKEPSGDVYVDGVKVKKTVTFSDDYHIYVLTKPLFNQTQKIRDAFNDLHQIDVAGATGPPLIIPSSPVLQEVREQTLPPCGLAKPPSSPTAKEVINFNRPQPPSPPF